MVNSNSRSKTKELQRRRVTAGLSQLALALAAGVSRWRLHLAERGAFELRPCEIRRIERVLTKVEEIASRGAEA